MRLSPEQARVVGSLIEKQLTTPQQYPLTLNALVLACNQSSNRAPVVEFDEGTVENALATLKAAGLVRFVHPSHGRSVTRYEQLLGEQLALSERQLALIAVLMLRGPQTVGELRSRTERMCDFDGVNDIDLELERLKKLPEPAVERLSRQPGQKEERWTQLLTDSSAALVRAAGPLLSEGIRRPAGGPADAEALTDVAAQVAELRFEIAELREQLALLRDLVEPRSRRDETT